MRIVFFVETEKNKRALRLIEEAKKRKIETKMINSYHCLATDKQIINETGKELIFRLDDFFWMTSNASVHHHLLKYLTGLKNFCWPSYLAIDFSDKYFDNCFFSNNNILTPKTLLLNFLKQSHLKKSIDYLGGLPLVIKDNQGSRGDLVALIRTISEIKAFIQKTDKMARREEVPFKKYSFILQEFIAESKGTDYRVLCLEDEIIGGIKRISQTDDFRANVSLGGKAEAFEVPDDLVQVCRKIMKKGKLFYAGLDFMQSERGWLAIEVNTSAQFEGFEKATGINVAGKIIDKLIEKNTFSGYNDGKQKRKV